MSTLGRLLLDAPVTPDAPTARRWATEELALPIYNRTQSLLDRFIEWFLALFDGLSVPDVGLPGAAITAIVVLLVLLVVSGALWATGPVRLARRRAGASAVIFGDDSRTAADIRSAADDCAARGDWSNAVLERFRAIVRSLEERALLDERPGRTAHEAAETAGARLPEHAADLGRAGRLFDDVCYGKVTVGPDSDTWLRGLDVAIAGTRPRAPGPSGRSLVVAP